MGDDGMRTEDDRGMTREAERALWARCREGDPEAREELIVAYRPLVFWLARKLKIYPSLRQDIVQEGMLALIGAVDRFDPGRDIRFSTYAYYRVRGQMINLLERSERRTPIPMEDEWLFAEKGLLVETSGSSDDEWLDVAESIERLQGREAAVVSALFFEGKHPLEVADEQKMDVSHVYRLRRSAVSKIRRWLGLDGPSSVPE
ncbi:MAG: sigma-70 family RNA polymerase sigma factor [Synergistaceae bacterium]|jgi:RNA polymerase sporulation-specific sigma factor|nr:sigma-70 family RNA polymerase sigma factor [Synergistaceae bacterium]